LPRGLGIAAIVAGIAIELGEAAFWIRVSRKLRPRVGAEALVGAEGVALSDCRPSGRVRVRGESWRALCEEGVDAGEPIVVLAVADLTLEVRRK
jgi:membrane protein implicated in regulation of membrane protease activity